MNIEVSISDDLATVIAEKTATALRRLKTPIRFQFNNKDGVCIGTLVDATSEMVAALKPLQDDPHLPDAKWQFGDISRESKPSAKKTALH